MAGYGVRRVEVAVPYEEAKQRVVALLQKGPARKSVIGYAIWPATHWRMPQGAAFASAKIIRQMEDEGLVRLCGKPAHHYELTGRKVKMICEKCNDTEFL